MNTFIRHLADRNSIGLLPDLYRVIGTNSLNITMHIFSKLLIATCSGIKTVCTQSSLSKKLQIYQPFANNRPCHICAVASTMNILGVISNSLVLRQMFVVLGTYSDGQLL